ncbi:D-alanyl-D-alanine carboxypeptidase [Streptomyces laurentii]|uniref:D-alanyl-D-alanine carboxypeptidase n=1 Tax=Streptomyces laurentii TaxID=39478 RepID=A0A160P0V7_STRLU|nr:D-alanyl-D-alanine carboxypeptidase [Streptomyces laurentii]
MAGESPDKAEQSESRDPRLSVVETVEIVEDTADTAGAADTEDHAGRTARAEHVDRVDQKTAVFRALSPRTAPDDEPAEPKAPKEPVDPRKAGAESAASGQESQEPQGVAKAAEADSEAGKRADGPSEPVTAETASRAASWAAREPEGAPEAAAGAGAAGKPEPKPVFAPEAGTASAAAEKPAASESWFATRKPAPAKTEAEATAAAEDGAKPEPESASTPEAKPEAEAKPESTPEAKPEPAAGKKPEPEPEPRTAPKPAVEDEPVDQPTTVFKAVKPPVVDQPTTALKIPPSTFRPLQGDITQEQPKPPKQAKASKEPKAQKPAAKPAGPEEPKPAAAPGFTAPVPVAVPVSLTEAERTKQQPLPPRPPLEILAELTNTPPPPETAMRTTVRRVKIWTPLILLLLVAIAVAQIVRPLPAPRLVLSAAPAYTFEGGALKMPWPNEGQGAVEVEGVGSMGTYGPQKPAPTASVAKTMTAYVILRDHPIKGSQKGPQIEVDKIAAEQAKAPDESTAPIKEGQSYSEKEMLQLLMIPSGNNVARLLARWDAGSEAAFVDKMNAAAKDLGMTGSTYTDPSGLKSSTVSTPLDQLKLAKAVMQYDVFREVVDMPNVTIDGIPNRIENNNTILLKPGVAGIKTGSSTPAGGNLLWAGYTVVDGEKRRILGIVMGAQDAQLLAQKLDLAIANSYTLIKKAQDVVTSATVVKKGQVLGYVDDGLGGRTPVVATKDIKAVGWPGLEVALKIGDGGKALPHTGKAGDVVGEVSIGTGTGRVSAPVALETDLAEPGFDKKLTRLG